MKIDNIEDARILNTFLGFAATSKLITPALLCKEHFNAVNSELHKLRTISEDIIASRSVLSSVFDDDIYKLNGTDYHKKLIKQFGGAFSRLFDAEYKKLITDLRLCKKDGKKLSYKEAVAMTDRLSFFQNKLNEYAESEAPTKNYLGEAYVGIDTEWNYIFEIGRASCRERV